MEPLPSRDDLTWLFEAEPTYPHDGSDALWPYTGVMFRTPRGGIVIELYIEPA
jgi:hypothetical protein